MPSMLETTFLNLKFKNPLVLASGIRGVTASSLQYSVKKGCGGVTLKSVSLQPRAGHSNPTVFNNRHFILNAIGLSNPGVNEINAETIQFKKTCTVPLIGSVFAGRVEDFAGVAEKIWATRIEPLEL